jgi:hypothetical protein
MAVGRAHTVAPGHLELLAAAGAGGVAVVNAAPNVEPRFEVGARYGLADRADVGLSVEESGALANVRLQALRAPPGTLGVELLAAPGIAYTYPEKLSFELPILLGLSLKNGNEVVLAPRVVEMLDFGDGDIGHPAEFVFVGGSVEFVWQLWQRVALVPELGLLVNAYNEPGFSTFTSAGPALQAAIGVLWDR